MSQEYEEFSGTTMGTYYRVHIKCPKPVHQAQIELQLIWMVRTFSTWEDNSLISKFNSHAANEWFPIPDYFHTVIEQSKHISQMTDGAFDVTIAPLVDVWGFGASDEEEIPSDTEIADLLTHVDYENLELRESPPALKKHQELRLDVAGIAKGFSVDRLAKMLDSHMCSDYLIDIGGEIRVKGLNPFANPWQIGIESPQGDGKVLDSFALSDMSVATSGNYRNFRVENGVTYSHIIDPRTGYPVDHNLVAVTVLHDSCATADAFATAMLVLGLEGSVELADRQDLAAIFITHDKEKDAFRLTMSAKMEPIIQNE